jgi:hypothetical protein
MPQDRLDINHRDPSLGKNTCGQMPYGMQAEMLYPGSFTEIVHPMQPLAVGLPGLRIWKYQNVAQSIPVELHQT